jgi:hypothetical protein
MFSNLKALIRYRTINPSLCYGKRRCSVEEVSDNCSDAPAEFRVSTLSFKDTDLIERIMMLPSEIKTKVFHPELEIILNKLTKLKQ